jgi:F-type H+-transporting ATPase subunit c
MIESALLVHYITIGATVALPAACVGLGQGYSAKAFFVALNQQPAARDTLTRLFLIGMALAETAAILSVVVGMMLFMSPTPSEFGVIAQIGAAIAIAIPAIFVGLFSSLPTRAAFFAIARQPLMGQQIMNLMLISLSILQTSVIFGLIISWLIQQQILNVTLMAESLKLLAAGLALAIGSIGPTIGLAIFAQQSCKSCGSNPAAYNSILSFTFLSQAIIETPILFSLVVALFVFFTGLPTEVNWHTGIVYIAAACTVASTTFGTGISSGYTARAACKSIGNNIDQYLMLSRASIIAQTLIDTTAIYGLIVALLMILSLT